MKTAVRVVGARPQYMQVLGLQKQLEANGVKQVLVHTGQHYDPLLADRLIKEMGLSEPNYNLQVGSSSHAQMTAQIMMKLEPVLTDVRPDFVIVDGDTNSTIAAALTAVKMRIPTLHVEAGVRDFDRDRPEEINRVLTDHAVDLNFSPIPRAQKNLVAEGLGAKGRLVGDFLLDNFLTFESKADRSIVNALGLSGAFNLLTLHRPENTDGVARERFFEILDFIASLDRPTVFPVHPRALGAVEAYRAARKSTDKIKFVEPMTYLQILGLLEACDTVFTDSGGLSRESVWAGRKTLMFFKVDTWHDLLENGWARIAKGGRESIDAAYRQLREPNSVEARRLFGDGHAAENAIANLREMGWV